MKMDDLPPRGLQTIIQRRLSLNKIALQRYISCLWDQIFIDEFKQLLINTNNLQHYQQTFGETMFTNYRSFNRQRCRKIFLDKLWKKGFDNFNAKILVQFRHFEIQVNEYTDKHDLLFQADDKIHFIKWYWQKLTLAYKIQWVRAAYQNQEVQFQSLEDFLSQISSYFGIEYQERASIQLAQHDQIVDEFDIVKKSQEVSQKQQEQQHLSDIQNENKSVIQRNNSLNNSNCYWEADISSPIYEKRYQPRSKRCSKDGFVNTYLCNYCSKSYPVNKKRALEHKKNCIKRNLKKRELNKGTNDSQILHRFVHESNHQIKNNLTIEGLQNQKLLELENQVSGLKSRINIILQKPGETFFQQEKEAEVISTKIWKETCEIITPLMQSQLKQQILRQKSGKVSFQTMLRVMKNSLVQRFYDFDMRQLLISWSYKLSDCSAQLIQDNKNHGCRAQTISRDNTASKYLQNFTQYQLTCNHKKLLQSLSIETKYKRTNVVRFYNKLARKFPQLKLKRLPINLNVYTFTFQRKIFSIQDVKDLIIKLWNSRQYCLAVDIWGSVCFGLRKSQYLKLFFKNKQGEYYKYIKIFQNKNKNVTTRFVPTSFIKLAQLAKVDYPITFARFAAMRDYCLKELGQYYGLRHICLTSLVIALLGNSSMHLHKQSSTTLSRYVNLENYEIVNKTFSLPQFESKFAIIEINYSIDYPYFNQRQVVQMYSLENKVQLLLQEDNEEQYVRDANSDSALSNRINQDYVKSQQIEEEDKLNVFSQSFIYKHHSQEFLQQNYMTYSNAINTIMDRANIEHSQVRQIQQNLSQPITVHSRLKIVSDLLKINIVNYAFTTSTDAHEININQQTRFDQYQTQASKSIVLSKLSSHIKIGDSLSLIEEEGKRNLQQNRFVPHKLRDRKQKLNDERFSYHFTPGTSFCQQCYKFLELSLKDSKYFLKCPNCKTKYQNQCTNSRKIIPASQIRIKPINCKYSKKFNKSIRACKKKNNLKHIIEEQFGKGSFSNKTLYSQQFPKCFTAEMNFHSPLTQVQILYNKEHQQFLPLEIRRSMIQGAGLGVFSLTKIQKQMLIITYSGIIRTHQSLNQKNDSLFILGCMSSNNEYEYPLQIMIQPTTHLNAGRYINTGTKKYRNNAESVIGLINNQDSVQIILYIYSNRVIELGEQILYSYGTSYSLIESANLNEHFSEEHESVK